MFWLFCSSGKIVFRHLLSFGVLLLSIYFGETRESWFVVLQSWLERACWTRTDSGLEHLWARRIDVYPKITKTNKTFRAEIKTLNNILDRQKIINYSILIRDESFSAICNQACATVVELNWTVITMVIPERALLVLLLYSLFCILFLF